MVMNGIYTAKEQREIQAGTTAYDRNSAAQIERENKPREHENHVVTLYHAIMEDNLEHLRFCQEDIGTLISLRERFPTDHEIQDRVRVLINIELSEIEKTKRCIDDDRAKVERFKNL